MSQNVGVVTSDETINEAIDLKHEKNASTIEKRYLYLDMQSYAYERTLHVTEGIASIDFSEKEETRMASDEI